MSKDSRDWRKQLKAFGDWAFEMNGLKELYYWFLLVFLGFFVQAQFMLYHAEKVVTPTMVMAGLNMTGIISLALGFILYIKAGRGVIIPAFIGGLAAIEMSNNLMFVSEAWLIVTIGKYVYDRQKKKA